MRIQSTVRLTVPFLVFALAACNNPGSVDDTTATIPPAPMDQPAQDVPPATAPPPAPSAGLARFDGYGDMQFGMTEAQARAAWGGDLNGDAGDGCHYLNPVWEHAPSYFAFMFDGGKFVRYDVGNDTEMAPGGGKRGMDEGEIRSLYAGRVGESPHKYVDGGKYLEVVAGDGREGKLVFETYAAGQVSAWHAGVEPQVDYVEGCS